MASPKSDRRTGATWTCPRCGRAFARIKQAHSCRSTAIETHFAGRPPELRRAFDALVATLKAGGPLRIDAVPSSINLVSTHHFGGVKVRRDHLRVGFLAPSPIMDSRIAHRQVIGPNRVLHTVMLTSAQDLTADLRKWLHDAQRLQA